MPTITSRARVPLENKQSLNTINMPRGWVVVMKAKLFRTSAVFFFFFFCKTRLWPAQDGGPRAIQVVIFRTTILINRNKKNKNKRSEWQNAMRYFILTNKFI